MNISLRMRWMALMLLTPGTFAIQGANGPLPIESELIATITSQDGASRTVKVEGVGCSVSICSRTVIKGRTGHESLRVVGLDTIAAIKDVTQNDALFVLKDGTRQRMALLNDFRVLYIVYRPGRVEKIDLAKAKSIEFVVAK